jgi:hypothetical protein
MPSGNSHPLIARGPLVAWDRELQAQRAVAEEVGEITRMKADAATLDRHHGGQDCGGHNGVQAKGADQEREAVRLNLEPATTDVEILKWERALLLARLEQQAELLDQYQAELESLRRFSAIARGVMVDLVSSRGYCLMRLLGRWKTLDKGIRRALR